MFLGETNSTGWRSTFFAGIVDENVGSTSGGSAQQTWTTKVSGFEVGSSVGYRFTEQSMIYGVMAGRPGKAQISVQTSNGTLYSYDDSFGQWFATIGYQYGKSWYFKMEGTLSGIQWKGHSDSMNADISDQNSRFTGLLGIGYNW